MSTGRVHDAELLGRPQVDVRLPCRTAAGDRLPDRGPHGLLRGDLPPRGPPSPDGARRPGRPVRHRHVARRGRAHPADASPTSTASAAPSRWSIQAVGKTTREMQQTCQVGTSLHAVVGPMGHAEPARASARTVLCVGGGLGVAPGLSRRRVRYKERGATVIGVLGFRIREPGVLGGQVPRGVRRADPVHRRRIGRDQGHGHRRASGWRSSATPTSTRCVAIGPPVMMKALREATRPHGHPAPS